jgi:hypothetical protein
MILVPTGMLSIAGVPMSSTRKLTQSIKLTYVSHGLEQITTGSTHVKPIMTIIRTQVWVDGNM